MVPSLQQLILASKSWWNVGQLLASPTSQQIIGSFFPISNNSVAFIGVSLSEPHLSVMAIELVSYVHTYDVCSTIKTYFLWVTHSFIFSGWVEPHPLITSSCCTHVSSTHGYSPAASSVLFLWQYQSWMPKEKGEDVPTQTITEEEELLQFRQTHRREWSNDGRGIDREGQLR